MNTRRSVPTLNDVARMARVSTATVSRCLNNPELVVQATRDKVMEAVHTLGYTPNFGARVMAAKRTYTIGAIIPTMENAIFARGLQAFQEAIGARGYTLLVSSSAYRPDVEAEQIRALVARGADGLLLIGHDRDPALVSYLQTQDVPALVAWTFDQSAALPSVGFDNRIAMRELAEEVIRQGHRRIAVISGVMQGNDRARQRVDGIIDAATDAGLGPSDVEIIETQYEVEKGAAAFETLMTRAPRPSVVMCGNDVLAVGALKQAHQLGLDVPGDVSITGFDDIELARIVEPALTTVHVPHREMGREAAQMLIDMVETSGAGQTMRLDTGLRLRGSLGAPA